MHLLTTNTRHTDVVRTKLDEANVRNAAMGKPETAPYRSSRSKWEFVCYGNVFCVLTTALGLFIGNVISHHPDTAASVVMITVLSAAIPLFYFFIDKQKD